MLVIHFIIIVILMPALGYYLYYRARQTVRKSAEKVLYDSLNELSIGGYVRHFKGHQKRYLFFNTIVQDMYGGEDVVHSLSWNQKDEDAIEDKMLLEGQGSCLFESSIRNAATGDTIYVVVDKKKLSVGANECYITTTLRDVTTRHHEEEDLLNARRSLDLVIDAAGIMVWDYSVETQKYRMLYGEYKKKDVSDIREICALIHPDDKGSYIALINNLLNGEYPNDKAVIEVRIPEESGRMLYYKCTILMTRDKSGNPVSVVGAFLDITQRKENEAVIRHNTDFLYTILNNIPFPIHVKDIVNNYQYNFWNETSRLIFGDCTNKRASALLVKEQAEEIDAIDRRVYDTGEMYHEQETLRMLDGRTLETIVHKCVIYDGAKKLILSVRWVIDEMLKLQRELEEVCRRNELVMNNTKSGLAYINADYVVQWENISHCSPELAFETYRTGEFCYASAYGKQAPCESCLLHTVKATKQMGTKEFMLKNGKHIEVLANPVLKKDGEVEGIVIRVDDVTDRQKILHDLNYAKQKAEESALLQSTFLENISHEIRTPLNAIVGFSDLLINTQGQEEREQFGEIITKNNELLLRLVNDILDLSKIESGIFDFNMIDVDLTALFDSIVYSFKSKMPEDVELFFEPSYESYVFYTDPERLTQIMTNFLINAIKFTTKGRIQIGYRREDGGVACYVSDTGIGIVEEKRSSVFERFAKVDRYTQGTGLGLSICKAIVEAYKGKIGVESEMGKGSIFWIWLPEEEK